MELPFAVDNTSSSSLPKQEQEGDNNDASSLMTASSQGSLVPTEEDGFALASSCIPSPAHPHHPAPTSQPQQSPVLAPCPAPPPPPPSPSRPQQQQQQQQHEVDRDNRLQPQQPPQTPGQQQYLTPPAPVIGMSAIGVDTLKSAGTRVTSMFSSFGYGRGGPSKNDSRAYQAKEQQQQQQQQYANYAPSISAAMPSHPQSTATTATNMEASDTEAIDFAYINVTDEDEVDIWFDDKHHHYHHTTSTMDGESVQDGSSLPKRDNDLLSMLFQTNDNNENDSSTLDFLSHTEGANEAARQAGVAKRRGKLQEALDKHTESAKLFCGAATLIRERDASTASSLLLLSQTQAKAAIALKRIVKLRPTVLSEFQSNRLRATLRGALDKNAEADISDSMFLGKASAAKAAVNVETKPKSSETSDDSIRVQEASQNNPVDEIMELERELRDMDMALELGNSIASLDTRTQNRMRSSVSESFMVVPGAGSYMSSSSILAGQRGSAPSSTANVISTGNAGVRARANRIQGNRTTRPNNHAAVQIPVPQQSSKAPQSLESSWWGHSSTTSSSQVLTNSVISLASTVQHHQEPANTKQLMRLMDSLRTLGDENAALLREVENAEAARQEAKEARQQMKRFKDDYGKRFTALKEALEKFRKGYPVDNTPSGDVNPVTTSEFSISAANSDHLQRQEQLIRKLTADLRKEKEECKRKDGALRKYESFYKEVKARSAQKSAQRQRQQQLQKTMPKTVRPMNPS